MCVFLYECVLCVRGVVCVCGVCGLWCLWCLLMCCCFCSWYASVCPSGLRGYVQVVMFSNAWVQIPQLTFSSAMKTNTNTLTICARTRSYISYISYIPRGRGVVTLTFAPHCTCSPFRASSSELRADPSTTHTHACIRPHYTPTTRPPYSQALWAVATRAGLESSSSS